MARASTRQILHRIGYRYGLVTGVLAVLCLGGCHAGKDKVVVYCALDPEFSKPILEQFEEQRSFRVLPKFDTEANKSVSLYEDLVREANRPRCDVHWNNEILATIRLEKKGLLQPYKSPSAEPYPQQFKSKDHLWHAFAARARIIIVNTDLVAAKDVPRSVLDLTEPRFRNKIAMAKPQFGTTGTHAACLFAAWGSAKTKKFYRELKANGLRLAPGNKQVAVGVGQGAFAVGITDTDDAIAEVRAGKPVKIIFPDQEKKGDRASGTLFIPNTVALIRNCPHSDAGKHLIDFLLSSKVEAKLAATASAQIPLNPNVRAVLPAPLRPALSARKMTVDFYAAAERWGEAQKFLTALFGR